jgi:hypothetical protein
MPNLIDHRDAFGRAAGAGASTTWYVAPGGSDNNDCMSPSSPCQHIQTAIDRAASGDAINIAAGTYTEAVSIGTSLTIDGAGADSTIIDPNYQGPGLSVAPTATVTLSDVTIQHGNAGLTSDYNGGGGINNQGMLTVVGSVIAESSATYGGGGISNQGGALTLINSSVSNNSATGTLGGGGILNGGALTLTGSAIFGNTSHNGGGVAIYAGTVILTNSSVFSNTAYDGGGISDELPATLTLTSSAVSQNNVPGSVGGIYNDFDGSVALTNSTVSENSANTSLGGIDNAFGTLSMTNSILAGNNSPSSPDCIGTLTSEGNNLVGIGDGCSLTNGQNGDQEREVSALVRCVAARLDACCAGRST